MATRFSLIFVISYILVFKLAYSYNMEEDIDKSRGVFYNHQISKTTEQNLNQDVIVETAMKIEKSYKNLKVKRSILKPPLLPEPNVATSSECRSCYKRRRGCFKVRCIFLLNTYGMKFYLERRRTDISN